MSSLKIGGQNVGKISLGDKLLLADGLKDLTGSMYLDSDNSLFIITNRNNYDVKIELNDTEYNIEAKSFFVGETFTETTVVRCLTDTVLGYNAVGFDYGDITYRSYRNPYEFKANSIIATVPQYCMMLIAIDDNFS